MKILFSNNFVIDGIQKFSKQNDSLFSGKYRPKLYFGDNFIKISGKSAQYTDTPN